MKQMKPITTKSIATKRTKKTQSVKKNSFSPRFLQQINGDTYYFCNAAINNVILAVNNLTEIANRMIPKNLRII